MHALPVFLNTDMTQSFFFHLKCASALVDLESDSENVLSVNVPKVIQKTDGDSSEYLISALHVYSIEKYPYTMIYYRVVD